MECGHWYVWYLLNVKRAEFLLSVVTVRLTIKAICSSFHSPRASFIFHQLPVVDSTVPPNFSLKLWGHHQAQAIKWTPGLLQPPPCPLPQELQPPVRDPAADTYHEEHQLLPKQCWRGQWTCLCQDHQDSWHGFGGTFLFKKKKEEIEEEGGEKGKERGGRDKGKKGREGGRKIGKKEKKRENTEESKGRGKRKASLCSFWIHVCYLTLMVLKYHHKIHKICVNQKFYMPIL